MFWLVCQIISSVCFLFLFIIMYLGMYNVNFCYVCNKDNIKKKKKHQGDVFKFGKVQTVWRPLSHAEFLKLSAQIVI